MTIGAILIALGTLLLIVSAIGLFRLRDALARQHAATKSATLSLGLILIGVTLMSDGEGTGLRVTLILILLVLTLPVSSHRLGRAAARETYTADDLEHAPRSQNGDAPS